MTTIIVDDVSGNDPPHIDPERPVSASTYQRFGCRCAGCRADAAARMAKIRARREGRTHLNDLSQRKATAAAVKWMRANDPERWAEFMEDARQSILEDYPDLANDLRKASA